MMLLWFYQTTRDLFCLLICRPPILSVLESARKHQTLKKIQIESLIVTPHASEFCTYPKEQNWAPSDSSLCKCLPKGRELTLARQVPQRTHKVIYALFMNPIHSPLPLPRFPLYTKLPTPFLSSSFVFPPKPLS